MVRITKAIIVVAVLVSVVAAVGIAAFYHPSTSPGNVVIPTTTKVLDDLTMQNLSSVTEGGSRLSFSGTTAQLGSISLGDVVIAGVHDDTPQGLLRKVASVSTEGDQVVIYTIPATLEDAIQDGTIEINRTLSPSDVSFTAMAREGVSLEGDVFQAQGIGEFSLQITDVVLYDDDGDSETTDDQIVANGSISISPTFNFSMEIRNSELKQLTFTNNITETAQLELEAKVSVLEVERSVEIARYTLTPITVWVGFVPVIITPVLTINVGLTGEVSVGITTGVTQEAALIAGLTYDDGQWSPVSEFSNDFQFDPPSVSAGATVKAYAGPQLSFLIYGVTGPHGEVNGYAELDADILSEPWWVLYGGLEAKVGVEVEILSHVLANYSATVIDSRVNLAQAETPYSQPGTLSGSVRDAVTGTPLGGVTINVSQQGSTVTTGTADANGFYSLAVAAGSGYSLEFSKSGYMSANYHNIAVEANTTTYLEVVLQIDEAHSGAGDASGMVVNALTGAGVEGLTINLRAGINVTTGTVVATATTQSGGYYSFTDLNAGNYTGEVSGSGYNTTYFTLICIGGTTTSNQDATITPILGSGETRIILTWGETPSDLDSHLTGPTPDGYGFHTYYSVQMYEYSGTTYAELDLDDTTSYGPETTTIYHQLSGVYRYSVHDYSNKDSSNSTALSNSGAKVRVYRGSDLVATFNVPTSQGGTLWTVFELSESNITPVNTMSYESDPSNITP